MVDARPDRPDSRQTRNSDDLQRSPNTTRTQDQTPLQEEHSPPTSTPDRRYDTIINSNEEDDLIDDEASEAENRQNRLAALALRLGLDAPTLMAMFK